MNYIYTTNGYNNNKKNNLIILIGMANKVILINTYEKLAEQNKKVINTRILYSIDSKGS
jgi:hypothetical protein